MSTKFFITLAILASITLANCRPPSGHNYKTGNIFSSQKSSGRLLGKSSEVSAANMVRVKLFEGGRETIQTERYKFTGNVVKNGSGNFSAEPGLLEPEKGIFKFRGKIYPGKMLIHPSGKNLAYINYVALDDYLVSVLSHEMNPSWPLEALKAQAVVSRTYLAQRMLENRKKPYDVDATTNHQVYGGLKSSEGNARKAVTQTGKDLVLFQSEPAQVFFHSSCGGFLSASHEVWKSKPLPYLSAKKAPHCESAPVYSWKADFDTKTISKKLGIAGIKQIRVLSRNSSRRVKEISISAAGKPIKISGEDFRRRMGSMAVRSTLFGMRQSGEKISLSGKGFGHGVGMCQWGAKIQAEKHKWTYKQIIEYYFPGTSVKQQNAIILAKN